MITWDKLTDDGKQILAEMGRRKTGLMMVTREESPLYSACVYLQELGLISVYVAANHITTFEITAAGRALIPAPDDHRAHYEAVAHELEHEVTRHLEFMLEVKDELQRAGYGFSLEYTDEELLRVLRIAVGHLIDASEALYPGDDTP